jgi:hypothetical protein
VKASCGTTWRLLTPCRGPPGLPRRSRQLEEVRAEHDELAVAERVDTVADTQEPEDQIGLLEGVRSRLGRTYAGEPDRIAEELAAVEAVKAAGTVLFTVPNQLAVAWCVTQSTAVKAIMTGGDVMAPDA